MASMTNWQKCSVIPGILSSLSLWASMASVVHVITGPMVSSFMLRLAARVFSLASRPALQCKAKVFDLSFGLAHFAMAL